MSSVTCPFVSVLEFTFYSHYVFMLEKSSFTDVLVYGRNKCVVACWEGFFLSLYEVDSSRWLFLRTFIFLFFGY